MAELKVFDGEGATVATMSVEFGDTTVNGRVLHQAITAIRNGARQGTHKTKVRSEVSGGGKKPYRQKGTGRARQGSTRAPHWRGGGTVFGPQPRSYHQGLNAKVGRAAFRAAVAARAEEDSIRILDGSAVVDGKTATMLQTLIRLGVAEKSVLLVANKDEAMVMRSARNLPFVTVSRPEQTNLVDVLSAEALVSTRAAFEALAKRLSA